MTTNCVCPVAGYCARHKLNKPAAWHALCQKRPAYFRAWERGQGPGQRTMPTEPKAAQPESDRILRQRAHWLELHGYSPEVWDEAAAREWFADWQRRIPNIACDCRRHWRELVAEMPPDFSSREAFFAWTVEAHNRVNQRLGKPLVTLEEAYRLHVKLCATCGNPATTICSHTLSLGMCGEPLCGSCTHAHVL